VWTGFEDECIYILLLVKVKKNYVPVIIIIIIIIHFSVSHGGGIYDVKRRRQLTKNGMLKGRLPSQCIRESCI
jgi:hypothetical protein